MTQESSSRQSRKLEASAFPPFAEGEQEADVDGAMGSDEQPELRGDPGASPPALIAVDWGTTHLRAYLLDANGGVMDRRATSSGVISVAPGTFPETLEGVIGDWCRPEAPPVIMSGMVGSRQGWTEVPYIPCPASMADIVSGVRQVEWPGHGFVYICPGLTCQDPQGAIDVLRGEETEVLGAMSRLPPGRVTLCLPGTHSKYVHVRDGMIESFSTHMTGELFHALSRQGMVGRLLAESQGDMAAFDSGLRRAEEPGGLLHHLFGVRTSVLFDQFSASSARDYLSGILIGHEILNAKPRAPVYLAAAAALAGPYRRALTLLGVPPVQLDQEVAAAGLYRLAVAMQMGLPA